MCEILKASFYNVQ